MQLLASGDRFLSNHHRVPTTSQHHRNGCYQAASTVVDHWEGDELDSWPNNQVSRCLFFVYRVLIDTFQARGGANREQDPGLSSGIPGYQQGHSQDHCFGVLVFPYQSLSPVLITSVVCMPCLPRDHLHTPWAVVHPARREA